MLVTSGLFWAHLGEQEHAQAVMAEFTGEGGHVPARPLAALRLLPQPLDPSAVRRITSMGPPTVSDACAPYLMSLTRVSSTPRAALRASCPKIQTNSRPARRNVSD